MEDLNWVCLNFACNFYDEDRGNDCENCIKPCKEAILSGLSTQQLEQPQQEIDLVKVLSNLTELYKNAQNDRDSAYFFQEIQLILKGINK